MIFLKYKYKNAVIIFFAVIICYLIAIINNLAYSEGLIWPIDCIPGRNCSGAIGYPDINKTGKAFDCSSPGYKGHEGTDISISKDQMQNGVNIFAAADGLVLWVFDGKYDKCPDISEPDCTNYRVCTDKGNYCDTGGCCCQWCFDDGNFIVIKHNLVGIFATSYNHLKKNSIIVKKGQKVKQGQIIAQVGSSGKSSGPHLHFEVWDKGYYKLADPWAGVCGPNYNKQLWKYSPPWQNLIINK
ncbi:MAG: M23 family metallopeptidase [Cyanobacteriota bacterium]